ncbi:MAG: LPXTG cell wall anchor domain-containing protein [Ferruginibacter sp.]|nr:LPXTG cell wall anchor domain-containing protein [Ferruginibacter sp.]
MKQGLLFVLLFCTINLFADTPGKAKMNPSKVSFQNLASLSNYKFFYQKKYGGSDSVYPLKDGSITIPGSGGAPDGIWFWGINTSTQKHTDTINVDNYYAPDYVFIINKVENDSIYYTKKELSNANDIVSEGETNDIDDKELIANAKKAKQNHYLKIGLFSALGLAALGGIIWFLRRRKKEENV